MMANEYDVTHAVLRYAAACARDGDWAALRDMGFGEQECEALRELTLGEVAALERRITGHVLRIQLDRCAFWMIINQVQGETALSRTKLEFVRRNAPAEMMERLFGMGVKEYATARRALHAPRGVGRPPEADEDAARRIWLVWERLVGDTRRPGPEDWLAIADESGVCLRVVWRFAKRWLDDQPAACSAQRHRRPAQAGM